VGRADVGHPSRADAWARGIGWVTVAAFVAGPLAALLLLGRVRDWIAVACFFGVPLTSLGIAFVAMIAHQEATKLGDADVAAWQERADGGRGRLAAGLESALVPFIYLLSGPDQRRLARYQRRTNRRRSR
jgi:hypothetical protein